MIKYSNNSLFLIKVLGISFMLIDHLNKYYLQEYQALFYNIGRLALPIFIFVISYNLYRIPVNKKPRIFFRLFVFGAISIYPYNLLGGASAFGWWPLNIFFTLCFSVLVVYLLEIKTQSKFISFLARIAAIFVFLAGGAFVEYFWPAIGLIVALWLLLSRPNIRNFQSYFLILFILILFYLINDINHNFWALAALPIIYFFWLFPMENFRFPRWKWFFYWFYPAHLWLIFLA